MDEKRLDKLERLARLREQGAITEREYESQKAVILNESDTPAPPAPAKELVPQKKQSNGCVSVLIGLVGLVALIAILSNIFSEKDTTPKTRDETVQSFFSAYDGSHPGLESAIKRSMNDPDSYEHVETRYSDSGSKITVYTKFRGKNAFGGTVISSARGTINGSTGELIDWDFIKE